MTDTTRMDLISNSFTQLLTSACTEGATEARKQFDALNVTVKELLALAFKPHVLPDDFDVSKFIELSEEDQAWENQQREQKEADDLEQCHPIEEVDENHLCFTCGTQCVPYQAGDDTHWLCEACYYGDSCDCNDCGGETGLDWNESGYCD